MTSDTLVDELEAILARLVSREVSVQVQAENASRAAEHRTMMLRSAVIDSSIPRLIKDVLAEEWRDTDTYKAVRTAAQKAIASGKHFIVVYGKPGTGKTIAAAKIMLQLVLSDQIPATSGHFASCVDLAHAAEWLDPHRNAKGAGVLLLDDLGQEKEHHERISNIITTRHNSRAFTLITSNLTPKDIKATYDQRIMQRLVERGVMVEAKKIEREGVR